MKPGKAWKMRDYDESGMPYVVEVSKEIADRVWHLDYRWLGSPDLRCAAFYDDMTGAVYAQPCQGDYRRCRPLGLELHLAEITSGGSAETP